MRRIALLPLAALVVAVGSAQAGPRATDPIVGAWQAYGTVVPETGSAENSGTITVTAAGANTFVGVASDYRQAQHLSDRPSTVCPLNGTIWEIRRDASTGRYTGKAALWTGNPRSGCGHVVAGASWTVTATQLRLRSEHGCCNLADIVFTRVGPPADVSAPQVETRSASGTVPGAVRVPFRVTDDSGRAEVHVTVKAGGKEYPGGPGMRSAKGEWQDYGMSLPAAAAGSAQFCVRAEDEAGNSSSWSCSSLLLQKKGDTLAPRLRALAASGKPGARIKLRWWCADNSGRSTFTVTVWRGSKRLASRTWKNVSARSKGEVHFTHWTAPPRVTPPLRFCVHARDGAGNSKTSCATIRLA